jgi:hypothetical protein
MGEACNTHWDRWEIYTKLVSGHFKGTVHLENQVAHGNIILEQILEKQSEKLWIGFIHLRIGRSDGFLLPNVIVP